MYRLVIETKYLDKYKKCILFLTLGGDDIQQTNFTFLQIRYSYISITDFSIV